MDLSDVSFFTPGDTPDTVVPTDLARSGWGANHLHGVAVSGALARAAEQQQTAMGRGDLQPARWTVDLFRPATMDPCALSVEVVREGRRLALLDVVLRQQDERVARASLLLLKPTEPAPGKVWTPDRTPEPPPIDLVPPTTEPRVPFMYSEAGWSQNFGEHQNSSRKASWNSPVRVVRGELLTPWQAVASIADGGSLVTNWGTGGVEYINSDITLSLARLPRGIEVGLEALDRVEGAGISTGTASVFDRDGAIGTVVLTCLANAQRAVDLGATEYEDDGTRHIGPRA